MELSPVAKETMLAIRDLIEFMTTGENYDAVYIIEMAQEMLNDAINEQPKEIAHYIAHYSRLSAEEAKAKAAEFERDWR